MRCLKIGWNGTSSVLGDIRQMLEQYGHISGDAALDLLVEDGSEARPVHADHVPWLSLRVGFGPLAQHGLPTLQLRAYTRDRRLLAVLNVADEPSGNGQRLRQQVTRTLVEWVALHVSAFSRDPGYFSASAEGNDWPEQGLQGLEALAYLHRFNRTADPAALLQAQVPAFIPSPNDRR